MAAFPLIITKAPFGGGMFSNLSLLIKVWLLTADGTTCFFWLYTWNNRLLSTQFPELFSFAKNQHMTVQSFLYGG